MIKNIFALLMSIFSTKRSMQTTNITKDLEKENKTETSNKKGVRDKVYDMNKNDFSSQFDMFNSAAVASEVPLCSQVGIQVLKRGGNAIDAGIATTLCVGLTNSFSSGIGGGGFSLYKNDLLSEFFQIDFRETAPGRIKEAFKFKNWSNTGPLSVGVPGEIMGLYKAKMMSSNSNLSWKSLFYEVIDIAEQGFIVSKELAKRIHKFQNSIRKDKGLREIYFKNGQPLKEGDIIYRKNYAETLRKISEDPMSFYKGELMEDMVKFLKDKGGVITQNDFKLYEVRLYNISETIINKFYDYDVYTSNLPSSGVFLILALNILENYELEELRQKTEEQQAYILIEIMKYLYTKRGEFGDTEKGQDEKLIEKITSKEYAKQIYEKIEKNKNRKLTVEDYHISASFNEDFGTSHISVVDKDGGIFCINVSINLEFGSLMMDPKTGILFNNTMNDFYIPNSTHSYTINGKKSENGAYSHKRPLSSMCPVILERNKYEKIVLGGAGGTRILTSIFKAIFDILMGNTLRKAISKPRIHHQMQPYKIFYENTLNKNIINYLKLKGNEAEMSSQNSIFVSLQGIKKDLNGIEAYSDERKGGESAGY